MKKQLLTIFAALALTTSAYAGTYGVGITGSLFSVETAASETTTAGDLGSANTNTKTIKNNGLMSASFYAEYTFDGFLGTTLGVDYTPGSADLRDTDLKRTETPASGENAASSTRCVIAGGTTPTNVNTIEFVTISTTSNTTDFGDLQNTPKNPASCSDVNGGLGD